MTLSEPSKSLAAEMLRQSCSDLADTNDNVGEDTEHGTGDTTAMKGSCSFDNAVLDKTSDRSQSLLEIPQSNMSHLREMADSRGLKIILCQCFYLKYFLS